MYVWIHVFLCIYVCMYVYLYEWSFNRVLVRLGLDTSTHMYVCMYDTAIPIPTIFLRVMAMAAYEHRVLRQAVCGEDDVVWKTELSEDSHEGLHCGSLYRLCSGYTTYINNYTNVILTGKWFVDIIIERYIHTNQIHTYINSRPW